MVSGADGPAGSWNGCSTDRGAGSQVATSASIYLILALGLLLNALALWVFCCRLRRWTETRVYMVNLAAADCLLLLSLPGVLHTLGQAPGAREGALCRVLQSFYYVNTYMSMWLLTAIAADRYAALQFPLRARAWRSPRQAAVTCAALWALVIVAVALPAAWLGPGESFCFGKGRTRGSRALVFSLLLFLLPLVILSFCSGQVLRHLLRQWARAQPQATGPILKALCVVAANLATFVLCFLPLHVALLAKLVAQWTGAACPTVQRVAAFVQVASRIANANCCLDAVCYYFVATEFQEEVGAVLARPWPFAGRVAGAAACGPPTWGPRRGPWEGPPRSSHLPKATVFVRSSRPRRSGTRHRLGLRVLGRRPLCRSDQTLKGRERAALSSPSSASRLSPHARWHRATPVYPRRPSQRWTSWEGVTGKRALVSPVASASQLDTTVPCGSGPLCKPSFNACSSPGPTGRPSVSELGPI